MGLRVVRDYEEQDPRRIARKRHDAIHQWHSQVCELLHGPHFGDARRVLVATGMTKREATVTLLGVIQTIIEDGVGPYTGYRDPMGAWHDKR